MMSSSSIPPFYILFFIFYHVSFSIFIHMILFSNLSFEVWRWFHCAKQLWGKILSRIFDVTTENPQRKELAEIFSAKADPWRKDGWFLYLRAVWLRELQVLWYMPIWSTKKKRSIRFGFWRIPLILRKNLNRRMR